MRQLGSTLGSIKIANGSVAQQGTKKYKEDIIDILKTKLNDTDKLIKAFNNADDFGIDLDYILVKQGVDSKSNFIVKKFPSI